MPTKTKRTIIPADPEDLICATCPARFPFQGDRRATVDLASTKGWYVHVKFKFGMEVVDSLCPECAGTPRTRVPPPMILEGQEDILTVLGVHMEPRVERKTKKGRDAS